MTSPETVAELAAETAKVLSERGWVGGQAETSDGRVCILRATYYTGCRSGADSTFSDFCRAAEARLGQPPEDWNDEPGRTEADVLDLLDAMASS